MILVPYLPFIYGGEPKHKVVHGVSCGVATVGDLQPDLVKLEHHIPFYLIGPNPNSSTLRLLHANTTLYQRIKMKQIRTGSGRPVTPATPGTEAGGLPVPEEPVSKGKRKRRVELWGCRLLYRLVTCLI